MPVVDAPPLLPPALVAPASREVSFGHVTGTVPPGTRRVIVRVGERLLADRPLRGRRFSVSVALPPREVTVRVTAVTATGRRASSVAERVFGLPRAAAPRAVTGRADAVLARKLRALSRPFPGTSAFYLQDLRRGHGAAWNAGARFPAASTLKLAIAVTVLARQDGKPELGSQLDRLLHAMIVKSDNDAANELEVWLGGSTAAGSAHVNQTMWSLGMQDSRMYGGYESSPLRRLIDPVLDDPAPIPIRVESAPSFGVGKHTSAADLATLLRAVYFAAGRSGLLPRLGVTPSEARYLLWLLAKVPDRAKLGRFLGGGVTLLHKAGWLATARHDAGIVFWPGGAFVATVMTWRPDGLGRSGDVLAGRVAAEALRRFR